MNEELADRIAARIDWSPTCLVGQERRTIVAQVLDHAAAQQATQGESLTLAPRQVEALRRILARVEIERRQRHPSTTVLWELAGALRAAFKEAKQSAEKKGDR